MTTERRGALIIFIDIDTNISVIPFRTVEYDVRLRTQVRYIMYFGKKNITLHPEELVGRNPDYERKRLRIELATGKTHQNLVRTSR